jgi:peptidoglycan-N-acetylglucosamine deacetylase
VSKSPILSVSVDLDELASYHEIHGLEDQPGADSRAIWTVAVPRLLDLFARLEVPATFFVVGRSLDAEIGMPALQDIAGAGHEVANHSFNHYYDLLRRGPAQRRDEVIRAAEAIEAATGSRPRGFRAPGYNIDDEMLELLGDLGYAYDSSVFPCPPYYLAKAAALMAIRTRGRQSKSLLGPKETLLAPTEPYRASESFWRRKRPGFLKKQKPRGLIELPIAVVPGVRTPFIGTTITLAGPRAASVMALALSRRRFIGLELHGIDLMDADDQDTAPLIEHQPDLRVSLERKVASLEAAITTLLDRGAQPLTSFRATRQLIQDGL